MTTDTQSQPNVKRHPIRGAVWGFLMGIGVALILFNFALIALGQAVPWLLIIGGFTVLGVLWGMFAPAKKPKGDPPASALATDPVAAADPVAADEGPEEPTAPDVAADDPVDQDGEAAPPADEDSG